MKRLKRLGILFGVLVIACIAAFCALRYEEHQEKIKNSEETILEVDPDTVTQLSWEYNGNSFTLNKEDDVWTYADDENFPVDQDHVQTMLELFQEFGVSFVIEDVDDYSQYGLDDPTCTITLQTEDTTYTIQLGNYSNMDEKRYVSIGDGNAYLVNEDPLETFDVELKDLIQNDEIPAFDQVTSMETSGETAETIQYVEDSNDTYREDDVYFVKQGNELLPLDTSLVNKYLSSLHSLYLDDYVTYNVTDEELESYGLKDPDLTLTVNYTSKDEDDNETDETFVIHVSHNPDQTIPDVSETDEEDDSFDAYVRIGESSIIYKITTDEYRSLLAVAYDDLRHKEVIPADTEDIKQIDVTLDGETYTLTSREEKKEQVWYYNDEKLEDNDFADALSSLKADSFTEESASGQEEISMTLYLDKDNDPEIHVTLYRYDGSDCLASVDGETVSLVKRSRVVDLMEAVRAIVLEKDE